MSGTTAWRIQDSLATAYGSYGLAFTSTGFTVSTDDSNQSATTYYWMAVRKCAAVDQGTYTGNGSTSPGQTITTGRQPSMVLIIGSDGSHTRKIATMSGDIAVQALGAIALASGSNGVAITSTGFTVKGTFGNTNGVTYHYFAMYELVGGNVHCRTVSYTGDNGVGNPPLEILIVDTGQQTSAQNKLHWFACGNTWTLGSVLSWSAHWDGGINHEGVYVATQSLGTSLFGIGGGGNGVATGVSKIGIFAQFLRQPVPHWMAFCLR
jgi:hypothetical protein